MVKINLFRALRSGKNSPQHSSTKGQSSSIFNILIFLRLERESHGPPQRTKCSPEPPTSCSLASGTLSLARFFMSLARRYSGLPNIAGKDGLTILTRTRSTESGPTGRIWPFSSMPSREARNGQEWWRSGTGLGLSI